MNFRVGPPQRRARPTIRTDRKGCGVTPRGASGVRAPLAALWRFGRGRGMNDVGSLVLSLITLVGKSGRGLPQSKTLARHITPYRRLTIPVRERSRRVVGACRS